MGRRARPVLPTPCSSPPVPPIAGVPSTTGPASSTSTTRRNAATSRSTATSATWPGTDKQVHLIDTPGYPDFIGNALSALAAVENVVLAVSGPSGIEVNTRRLFHEAGRLGLGRFVVVTKMDAENVDYRSDLDAIRESFGTAVRPVQRADRPGPDVLGHRRRHPVTRRGPRRLPRAADRGLSDGRRADRRARRGPDDALPRGRDDRARRAAQGRARRDRPGQARPGALRLHPQGPRRPRAARADHLLRPQPRRRPPLRHPIRRRRRPRGRDPARRGRHPGRPGLQDDERPVHGQAELPPHPQRPHRARHDAGEPAQRQDDQGRPRLHGSRASSRRRSTRRSPATSSPSPSSTTCTSPTR